MKKDSRQRMFEVMGRLDKTFKPKLNENFEEIETSDDEVTVPTGTEIETSDDEVTVPTGTEEETSDDEVPEIKEKSPEEKLEDITAKIDELHKLIHGETEADDNENNDEIEIETGEIEPDELQEEKIPVESIAKVGK